MEAAGATGGGWRRAPRKPGVRLNERVEHQRRLHVLEVQWGEVRTRWRPAAGTRWSFVHQVHMDDQTACRRPFGCVIVALVHRPPSTGNAQLPPEGPVRGCPQAIARDDAGGFARVVLSKRSTRREAAKRGCCVDGWQAISSGYETAPHRRHDRKPFSKPYSFPRRSAPRFRRPWGLSGRKSGSECGLALTSPGSATGTSGSGLP